LEAPIITARTDGVWGFSLVDGMSALPRASVRMQRRLKESGLLTHVSIVGDRPMRMEDSVGTAMLNEQDNELRQMIPRHD